MGTAMLKMVIVNCIMLALLTYDVVLFCRYKGWLGNGRKNRREAGKCKAQTVSAPRGKRISK